MVKVFASLDSGGAFLSDGFNGGATLAIADTATATFIGPVNLEGGFVIPFVQLSSARKANRFFRELVAAYVLTTYSLTVDPDDVLTDLFDE